MKKVILAFALSIFGMIAINAGCPSNCGGKDQPACNGVCVAVYGSNGSISSYFCSTGSTGASKDCLAATGGTSGVEHELSFD